MIRCKKCNEEVCPHFECSKCKTCFSDEEEAEQCCNAVAYVTCWCEKCFNYPKELIQD